MKLNSATCKSREESTETAFTLIEMIGVLAVIAILAALLIPKVFDAISTARVNNAAVSLETMKTAITDHYGKYGLLTSGITNSGGPLSPLQIPCSNYDTIMLIEGFLDKPFSVKIGSTATIQLVTSGNSCGGGGYVFDNASLSSTGTQTYVAEAVINDVVLQDAIDLNNLIDGTNLAGASSRVGQQYGDGFGRVEFVGSTNAATVTVYVYLTGR